MQVSQHQVTMTEWFAIAGKREHSQRFRDEDVNKMARLKVLTEVIGLPARQPVIFSPNDLIGESEAFKKLIAEQGDGNCAIRLEPLVSGLPKLRTRGVSLRDGYENWFKKQTFDPNSYQVSISFFETELEWCLIIVVKEDGILGEIIRGDRDQISQGETVEKLYQFHFDFKTWEWSDFDEETARVAMDSVALLYVPDIQKRQRLTDELQSTFSHDYLVGYYEAIIPVGRGIDYYDYNRMLPELITIPQSIKPVKEDDTSLVRGVVAHKGIVQGHVRIVLDDTVDGFSEFEVGDVLVCDNTDARYLAWMQQASAIITDRGSVLSHAAIIARELGKPCIVATKDATKILSNGQTVEVNADTGRIRSL